jgi:hypothetical protein
MFTRPGTGVTRTAVARAERRLLAHLGEVSRRPGRQLLGLVQDFLPPQPHWPALVADRPVFYEPHLTTAAATTNGWGIDLGPGAFEHRGASGHLGDTFVHEVEHVLDFHTNRQRPELTPRWRQLLRELEPDDLIRFQTRHGRAHAREHLTWFFERHPGHALTSDELAAATEALMKFARARPEKPEKAGAGRRVAPAGR